MHLAITSFNHNVYFYLCVFVHRAIIHLKTFQSFNLTRLLLRIDGVSYLSTLATEYSMEWNIIVRLGNYCISFLTGVGVTTLPELFSTPFKFCHKYLKF